MRDATLEVTPVQDSLDYSRLVLLRSVMSTILFYLRWVDSIKRLTEFFLYLDILSISLLFLHDEESLP